MIVVCIRVRDGGWHSEGRTPHTSASQLTDAQVFVHDRLAAAAAAVLADAATCRRCALAAAAAPAERARERVHLQGSRRAAMRVRPKCTLPAAPCHQASNLAAVHLQQRPPQQHSTGSLVVLPCCRGLTSSLSSLFMCGLTRVQVSMRPTMSVVLTPSVRLIWSGACECSQHNGAGSINSA